MRIDRLRVENFKQFESYELELDPGFNLLVGENGTGKTTLLEALAVALGVWLVKPPDVDLVGSRRGIYKHEIRLDSKGDGDRVQFYPRWPVRIEAWGQVLDQQQHWTRQILEFKDRTDDSGAQKTIDCITEGYARDADDTVLFPVVAYYGAGRAWLPSNRRPSSKDRREPARRWAAFDECFQERIDFTHLTDWFRREALAALNGKGYRPGYKVVQKAIMGCLPGATAAWFDGDRQEVVATIDGRVQPLRNLSSGQKMMLAMVADLAIKMITQNNWLVTEDSLAHQPPEVLRRTPGVVLIDEIDVHLHPLWQRRIIGDLRATFPAVQFVATTHSPFVIQALGDGKLIRVGADDVELWPHAESLEDIAEAVQGVPNARQSERAKRLEQATERYYTLLKQKSAVDPEVLASAEAEFRKAGEGFSTQPGLEAVLKLEAMAAEHGVS